MHAWRIVAIAGALGVLAAVVARMREAPPDTEPTDDEPTLTDELSADAMATLRRITGTDASSMTLSAAGLAAIQSHEGLRLERYRLGDGGWTIGWGRFFPDSGPPPPERITRELADSWLMEDVEARGARWVRAYVTAPLNQGQFDALVSMAYNLSPRSFRTIADAVNAGQDPEAAALRFVRAGTNLERGLRRRRAAELAMYRSGVTTA